MFGLQVTAVDTVEPVSIATLKQHLRLNLTDDDATLLPLYLKTARQMFETQTNRTVVQTTYKLSLDQWYTTTFLPRAPVRSVTSVKYYDTDDNLQTLSSSAYYTDLAKEPCRIIFKDALPSISGDKRPRIEITFEAGYTKTAYTLNAPESIQVGIMLKAGDLFNNREASTSTYQYDTGWNMLVGIWKVGNIMPWGME